MVKKVIVAGLLGGLVMIGWTFVVNGLLGFGVAVDMHEIPHERQVYEVLRARVTEPGRYICNPGPTENGYPPGEPVFSVLYGGVGHEAAGGLALVQLAIAVVAPMIAAWMLSLGSERVLSSYPRKVLFFTALGLLLGLTGHLMGFGIGGYPLNSALILTLHSIALWTVIGLVVAWRLKPSESVTATDG
jgi:hypothetical protein